MAAKEKRHADAQDAGVPQQHQPLRKANRVCQTADVSADGPVREIDPVIEAYKRDVDRTLIRENLRRSVQERFEHLIELQRLAAELKRAGAAARR